VLIHTDHAVALRSRLQSGMFRARHGTARNGMCESNAVALCYSNGEDTIEIFRKTVDTLTQTPCILNVSYFSQLACPAQEAVSVCMNEYTYVHMYVFHIVYVYVYMCVCMYVCMYVGAWGGVVVKALRY
jgi:hypothetical protein